MRLTFKYQALCLLLILGMAACKNQVPAPPKLGYYNVSERLPADCKQVIDSFITSYTVRKVPHEAIAAFNRMAARYRDKDSFAYAAMRGYSAQAWDALQEGDSMIAASETALEYFDRHPEYVDMRSSCHLYIGWGHYYKKQLVTANYFFSLSGNDITDTVYLPAANEYAVSHYPAITKAGLLDEIAGVASLSLLHEQAKKYMNLSLRYALHGDTTDPFVQATVLTEAGNIYSVAGNQDSAAYFLGQAKLLDERMNDPTIHTYYLDVYGNYLLRKGAYDSSILVLETLRAIKKADTLQPANSTLLQDITLLNAYTHKGNYAAVQKLLDTLRGTVARDSSVDDIVKADFLEAQIFYLLARTRDEQSIHTWNEYLKQKSGQFDQQRIASINDMNARYSLRRKEDNISRLNLANEVYARKNRQQNIMLAIAALSVLLLGALIVIFWQRMARRRLQSEKDKIQLEQRLLRSQMEPHFIFNTLSVLQGLIRKDEKEQSIRYLSQFARLLRISLENARESFVPLRDEVEALTHYLSLQQVRFQNVFAFSVVTWDGYEEESEELLIPPMLLQPFAENAVQHGMQGMEDNKGLIDIHIEKRDAVIVFTISDNGSGMRHKDLAAPVKRSLSTVITTERLDMLGRQTGQPASLTISENERSGVRVQLLIPYVLQPMD